MSELKETPKAIDWPRVQIGAEEFTLRYSYASNYQLAKWGKTIQTATNVELAASMCGKFNSAGHWHSTGFQNPVELADLLSEVDADRQQATETALLEGITDALKKAFPGLEVAQTPAQNGVATAKTDSSNSGPSPLAEAV
jgi:hypothetical protein